MLWARGLTGLGFGGEWTAGAVLIGEVIRPRDRGKAVGMVQAGWALGWGLSTLLFTVVYSWVPAAYAWRVLFAIGILPAPFVIYIRRFVDEPEVHRKQQRMNATEAKSSSMLDIFAPGILWTTIRASVLATGVQGGYYAVTTWLPTYLKTEKGLSIIGTGGYLGVIIAGSYCGYLTGAWLSDRIGRKRADAWIGSGFLLHHGTRGGRDVPLPHRPCLAIHVPWSCDRLVRRGGLWHRDFRGPHVA